MTTRIATSAEADLEDAFEHYEMERAGLGLELLEEYRHTLALVVEHPFGYQKFEGEYRRAPLARFPYGLIYTLINDEIMVAAVFHFNRKPGSWKR